jgi:biotin transport system substrate-specific component
MKDVSAKSKKRFIFTVYDITYIAMSIAIITLCSWITIPSSVPFTMQTFAVFVIVALFGIYRGTVAIILYLLLGALGAPIFSGFGSGFGYLLGNTGGYLIGFIFSAITTGVIIKYFGNKTLVMFVAMLVGLIICYSFGTAYFYFMYTKNSGSIGFITVLLWCVIPFIIPDFLKIILAIFTYKRFSKYVKQR